MENENIMAVFSELLENQKEIARAQKDMTAFVQEFKPQLEKMESSILSRSPMVERVDIKPILQAIERSVTELKNSIHLEGQNQHSDNLRVFLESDAKKWAVYLLVSLTLLTYVYLLFHK